MCRGQCLSSIQSCHPSWSYMSACKYGFQGHTMATPSCVMLLADPRQAICNSSRMTAALSHDVCVMVSGDSPGCKALGKLELISGPQFPHLQHG